MKEFVREFRGIPKFLLKEYLVEMGGIETSEDKIECANFNVTFEKMEPFKLGSLVIGQNRLLIKVTPEYEQEFFTQFGKKTLRAGG